MGLKKDKSDTTQPGVDYIIEFIMQAEELAEGKQQKKVVSEVANQFGELMYYIGQLETQRDNFKKSYTSLLNSKRKQSKNNLPSSQTQNESGDFWPSSEKCYW